MPRRPDAHLAYWLDVRGVLHGYPQERRLPPRAVAADDPESRLGPNAVVTREDLTWNDLLEGSSGGWCVLVLRDRQGFRWERRVGPNDFVSQADAAQLLGVPLMRVNRWLRPGGPLKSKKRRGYSVVRVKDLYDLATKLRIRVPRGRVLAMIGSTKEASEETIRRLRTEGLGVFEKPRFEEEGR